MTISLLSVGPVFSAPALAAAPAESQSSVKTEFETQTGFKDGRQYVRIELTNGTAKESKDGKVHVMGSDGEEISTLTTKFTLPDTGETMDVSYKISADGKRIEVFPDEQLPSSTADPKNPDVVVARNVDQKCALNNVLWGMGGGVVTGAVGGPVGIAGGVLTGVIIAGVQSAASC